jgi:hypothetical protein
MNAESAAFLKRLEKCGWFRGLPKTVAVAVRRQVGTSRARNEQPREALVSVAIDSRYLLSERPYSTLLRQFAEASGGLLRPDSVTETTEGLTERFKFVQAGRIYELTLPADADEPPAAFYATINRAMHEAGSELRFAEILDLPWSPVTGFVLCTPKAFSAAVRARLFTGRLPKTPATRPKGRAAKR